MVTSPRGTPVIVVVHGGGIFASPERFERTYRASVDRNNPEGFTGQYAGKISPKEASDVLNGKLPDGTEIPVYQFDEFKRGISNLPRRYGVVLDYELARQPTRGFDTFEVLGDEPNLIARAGGIQPLAAYLDKAQARHNTKKMGNWHPYNRIDPKQPQTRIVFLAGNQGGVGSEDDDDDDHGYDAEYGIGGDACIHNMARYVAVAPRDVSTSLRYLDQEGLAVDHRRIGRFGTPRPGAWHRLRVVAAGPPDRGRRTSARETSSRHRSHARCRGRRIRVA